MARLRGESRLEGPKVKLGTTVRKETMDRVAGYHRAQCDRVRSPGEAIDEIVGSVFKLDRDLIEEMLSVLAERKASAWQPLYASDKGAFSEFMEQVDACKRLEKPCEFELVLRAVLEMKDEDKA